MPSSVERSSRSVLRNASIVLSCAIGMSMSIARVFQSTFTIFVKPLAEEFGWSRTQLTLGYSLSTLALALCTPVAGRLADTFGPRTRLADRAKQVGVDVTLELYADTVHSFVLFDSCRTHNGPWRHGRRSPRTPSSAAAIGERGSLAPKNDWSGSCSVPVDGPTFIRQCDVGPTNSIGAF